MKKKKLEKWQIEEKKIEKWIEQECPTRWSYIELYQWKQGARQMAEHLKKNVDKQLNEMFLKMIRDYHISDDDVSEYINNFMEHLYDN